MGIRGTILGLVVGGIVLSCSPSERDFGNKGEAGAGGAAGNAGTAGNSGGSGNAGGSGKAGDGGQAGAADNAGAGGDDSQASAGSSGADGNPGCSADEYDDGVACRKLTTCTATEYEKSPPTSNSDRVCALVSTCVAGTFVKSEPSATADRTCSACAASTFSSLANAAACKPWSQCMTGEAESVAPSATSDRVCSACGAGKYSANSQCLPLTVCTASQYESVPATATSDRKCAALTACSASQYESVPATAVSDRKCTALTACTASQYESVAATATSDRKCSALTVCSSSQYESAAATATTDRKCSALTVCSSSQYQSAAPTATTDRKCTALTVCSSSQYESAAASATTDRKCSALTVCSSSQYESAAPTATADRKCTALTVCQAGSKQTAAPTATTDRKCAACDAGTYSTTQNAALCTAWSTCSWTQGGVATAGTASSNAVCGTPSQYRQFGTSAYESAAAVATDGSGNVYVVGATNGALVGTASVNGAAFIRKYDPNGTVLWTRQFGNSSTTRATSVAPDSSGNVYLAGYTGALLEGTWYGSDDAFVRKYDGNGNVLWTRQFGTTWTDQANGVAVDGSGYSYVVGSAGTALTGATEDAPIAFIRKFDTSGGTLWTKQWANSSNNGVAYAVKAIGTGTGTVYVAGNTGGGELRTFALNGTPGWVKSISGTISDTAYGLAVLGSGEAFVTGYTSGNLAATNAGSEDVFLRKFAANGDVLWTTQFGTPDWEEADAVAVDGNGNAYVTGYTLSAIAGTNAGGSDVFLRKYSSSGGIVSTQQFGTTSNDHARGMAIDNSGTLYIAGDTEGAFVGTSFGSADAYVRQIASP